MRRIRQLWDWLPAFRAVAETEHLGRAAERLHVTPPALSRTLKILEADLGQPLFERKGRSLELNAAGHRLLQAVRTAMRGVHEAVQDLEAGVLQHMTVASSGIFTATTLHQTLARLLATHPNVHPRVVTVVPRDPGAELLRGQLDLLFTSTALYREGLTTVMLCRVESGVYCGPGHPLYGRAEVEVDELSGHLFVAPPADENGMPTDGWPGEWPRRIALEVDRQTVGMAICESGSLLAVLPDLVTTAHPSLFRLGVELSSSTSVLAVHRESVGEPGPVEWAVRHAADLLQAGVDHAFVQEKRTECEEISSGTFSDPESPSGPGGSDDSQPVGPRQPAGGGR